MNIKHIKNSFKAISDCISKEFHLDSLYDFIGLTEIQRKLFSEAIKFHGEQKRKYTGVPYYTHLAEVVCALEKCYAGGRSSFQRLLVCEIAICHDLVEDVNGFYMQELADLLISIGYSKNETKKICFCVDMLTERYTKEDYPDMNRSERKLLEAARICGMTSSNVYFNNELEFPEAKLCIYAVKLADLISNTSSIAENDHEFAAVYLNEKQNIMDFMSLHEPSLRDGFNALFFRRLTSCADQSLFEATEYLKQQHQSNL